MPTNTDSFWKVNCYRSGRGRFRKSCDISATKFSTAAAEADRVRIGRKTSSIQQLIRRRPDRSNGRPERLQPARAVVGTACSEAVCLIRDHPTRISAAVKFTIFADHFWVPSGLMLVVFGSFARGCPHALVSAPDRGPKARICRNADRTCQAEPHPQPGTRRSLPASTPRRATCLHRGFLPVWLPKRIASPLAASDSRAGAPQAPQD